MMKTKLTHSLPVKVTAILLAAVLFILGGAMLLFGGALLYAGGIAGTAEEVQEQVMETLLQDYAYAIAEDYWMDRDVVALNADQPFTITVYDENDKPVLGEAPNTTAAYAARGHYWYASEKQTQEDGSVDYIEKGYTVHLALDSPVTGDSRLATLWRLVGDWFARRWWLVGFGIANWVATLVLAIFLYCAAGRRAGEAQPRCNAVDRIPLDVYTALWVVPVIFAILLIDSIGRWGMPYIGIAVITAVVLFVLYAFSYTMSIATRLKTHTLWSNTVVARLLKLGKAGILLLCRRLPLLWKTLLVLLTLGLVDLILQSYSFAETALVLFLKWVVLLPLVLWFMLGLRRLQRGVRRIADGDVQHTVSPRYLYGELATTAGDINRIGGGLNEAVEARVKSERFKTELITNISHDIKTPLTSIINYVDLLAKEPTASARAEEYVATLQRQSGKMKKLIEDLLEASKASTGNLPVEPAPCELGVLLEQCAGEYAERAAAARLDLRLTVPPTSVTVMADGKHLWRVLDNLLSNACKYAMPGTRVYLDLVNRGNGACITVRNISRQPLQLSGEELQERFVRGDSSRNTEGSGLGLAIARSLTELQGGTLEIAVDGDLFKAILTLPKMA